MNGVINIYKEKGYSSFHVVYELRKLTGEQKVGHTGTLDPDVTGVLPVCIGKATKLVGQLTDTDKIYRCRMLLGRSTDTQDVSGQILREVSGEQIRSCLGCPEIRNGTDACLTVETSCQDWENSGEIYAAALQRITAAIKSFEGETEQIPPMYSALKKDGAKLVNLARRGIEVERTPRRIRIYSISDILLAADLVHVDFTVHCSRGTYVRTLCEDIGKKLGIPACMEDLERTYAAGLGLDSAMTLSQVKTYAEEGTLEEHILPPDRFLQLYPSVTVTDEAVCRLIYGNYLYNKDLDGDPSASDGGGSSYLTGEKNGFWSSSCSSTGEPIFRVYDRQGQFYALYRYDGTAQCYKCVKMFL